MKILFLSRATLFSNPGGDTIQMIKTADFLKKYGVYVDIKVTTETIDYDAYNLLHFFNVVRPADILTHIKKGGIPYVLSTIFVDYSEFEKTSSSGFRKLLLRLFTPDFLEYLKVIGRFIKNGEKVRSAYYILNGHKKAVQNVITNAALLLPNSAHEYQRLKNRYDVAKEYKVIPNGIDSRIFKRQSAAVERYNDNILCVARFEPLKNQLNLIRAVRNTGFQLLLIGRPSANHKKYYTACKEEAGPNVEFIDHLPQEELLTHYQRAKVHVLPSWFETTGLSSLEAASCGCNIVITDKGDTREYFGEYAYYCNPASVESIREAIQTASSASVNPALQELVVTHYTWENAAKKTHEAYKKILQKG